MKADMYAWNVQLSIIHFRFDVDHLAIGKTDGENCAAAAAAAAFKTEEAIRGKLLPRNC